MPSFEEGITIPLNPDYQGEPVGDVFELANPVALNNHSLVLANSMLHVATAKVHAMRRRAKARLELRKLKADNTKLVRGLLKVQPLNGIESKNLRTTDAAIALRVSANPAIQDAFEQQEHLIDQLEADIERESDVVEQGSTYWATANAMMEAIRTHLAYVKDERRKTYER